MLVNVKWVILWLQTSSKSMAYINISLFVLIICHVYCGSAGALISPWPRLAEQPPSQVLWVLHRSKRTLDYPALAINCSNLEVTQNTTAHISYGMGPPNHKEAQKHLWPCSFKMDSQTDLVSSTNGHSENLNVVRRLPWNSDASAEAWMIWEIN